METVVKTSQSHWFVLDSCPEVPIRRHTYTHRICDTFAEAAEDLEEDPRAHFNIRSKRVIRRYVEDQAAFPHPTLNAESPNHLQKCRSDMH